ncbi:MAG: cyclic pyranopterin monophosphate synthase MoaC [Ignavibacteriae bacterium HGW-Ignavibacteriae-3]|nr:MAG: cyclic pyranopterin monophosphate synthase MoaC [Ignavibacteriae bacterium HGW-Ignavibacteriae-3]
MKKFSHIDSKGRANMVDVAGKKHQYRSASAEGFIRLQPETILLIKKNKFMKGDVLTIAEIAGIQAGKKTSELIPLCHPLQITKLDVKCEIAGNGVSVKSFANCLGQTGIEMEALTAVSIALVTVYDMCKAVDKKMKIESIKLLKKTKSDEYE